MTSLQRETASSLPASKKYKNVMGTDGDLRKLKLHKAKTLLRNFGVPEEEVTRCTVRGTSTISIFLLTDYQVITLASHRPSEGALH